MDRRLFLSVAGLKKLPATLLLCASIIMIISGVAQAQSGRRAEQPKSPVPAPTPAASETPAQPPTGKKPLPRLSLVVGTDRLGQSMNVPLYYYDLVLDSFNTRLRESAALSVTIDKSMSRKQASDRAKAEAESHVVWLQVESEGFDGGMGGGNPSNLIVSYVIYTPGTGKPSAQGHVYQRPYRGVLGGPLPPMRNAVEYQLYQAGRDAAERVLDALQIAPPSSRP